MTHHLPGPVDAPVTPAHAAPGSDRVREASLADGELCLEDAVYAVLSALWSVETAATAVSAPAHGDALTGEVAASVAGAHLHLSNAVSALRVAGEGMSRLLDARQSVPGDRGVASR